MWWTHLICSPKIQYFNTLNTIHIFQIESNWLIFIIFILFFCFSALAFLYIHKHVHTINNTFAACLIYCIEIYAMYAKVFFFRLFACSCKLCETNNENSHTKISHIIEKEIWCFCTHIQNDFVLIVCLQFRYICGCKTELKSILIVFFSLTGRP